MHHYSRDYLNKVADAHRKFGFRVRTDAKGLNQYMKFDSRKVATSDPRIHESAWRRQIDPFNAHILTIFPGAYITSGLHSSDGFEVTYRINP